MDKRTRIAGRIFVAAAIYGIIVLLPQYFLEDQIGRDYPPPLNHPEHFYGFIGVALAWQVAFLIIASDVRRYRPFMLAAILEKLAFGIAAPVLSTLGRAPAAVAVFGVIDLLLAVSFAVAYRLSAGRDATPKGEETPEIVN